MFEDKMLIRRLKQGDGEVLRTIYANYKDDLLTVATCMLGESRGAEDILRDVFVSFASGIRHFYLLGTLKSYLVTCVVRRVREKLRRKMYQVEGLDSSGPLRSTMDKASSLPSENDSEMFLQKFSHLPSLQREVIAMHLPGAMKFREIAGLQGISTGSARGRYRYGLEKLASILQSEVIE